MEAFCCMLTLAVCLSCFYFFSLFCKSSFRSIKPTFSICLFKLYSLYFLFKIFCFITAQFLWYSSSVEHIAFNFNVWLYAILFFNALGCSDLARSKIAGQWVSGIGLFEDYFLYLCIPRNSRPEMFCEKGVLRNFAKFTGKHLCQSLFFNKVAGPRPATLLKKRLWHRCFPVNFAKFLRTTSFIEHLWWLLLYAVVSKNGNFCDEISYSNLIVLCFLFSSLINVINCSFVPFHMINMSSIYLKYKRATSLVYGYICFSSNCAINRLASDGTHTAPLHVALPRL